SPTGCAVEVDLAELAAGASTQFRMSALIHEEIGEGGVNLVVSHLPLGTGPDEVLSAIAHRIAGAERWRPHFAELAGMASIPLRDLRDESSRSATRLVCELEPGADPTNVAARLRATMPVTIEFSVKLALPLATLLRKFADVPERQREAMLAL